MFDGLLDAWLLGDFGSRFRFGFNCNRRSSGVE
jgi:hypothetical protein